MRLTWTLPGGPHVLTDPELVVRQFTKPVNGQDSVEHAASNIERRATVEEVEQWRNS